MGAGLKGTGADVMGAGLIVIGAGTGLWAIITGLDIDVASMTLGLGSGDARPTPMRAKFELSSSSGQGFICREYMETRGRTGTYVRIVHAIKSPRSTLGMDSIYLGRRIFPRLTLSMRRSRWRDIWVCTSNPLWSYVSSPLNRHSVQNFATHDARKRCS